MDFTGAGTAIMLALAAVLWFLYLLPSWMRRREFLATERNATRLQRAIRVMAEAAEAPVEVCVEATAREAARTERLLAQERRRAEAEARAEAHAAELRARAAERRAAELARAARRDVTPAAPSTAAPTQPALARLRRSRRLAGLLLLGALATAGVQVWLMATTGIALGAWLVLGAAVLAAGISLQLQRRIAARTRALVSAPAAPARRAAPTLVDLAPAAAAPARAWTPVPVPKPLYLERGEAPRVPVEPPVSAEQLLRAAAEEAQRALAAAHAEPEVVRFRPREGAPAAADAAPAADAASAPSRFAAMGHVDDLDTVSPDLDEVLRRRRSVG